MNQGTIRPSPPPQPRALPTLLRPCLIHHDRPQSLDQLVQRLPSPPGPPLVFSKFSVPSSTHSTPLTLPRSPHPHPVLFPTSCFSFFLSLIPHPGLSQGSQGEGRGFPKGLVLAFGAPHWEVGWD